jgi:hypothetical protein
LQFITYSTVYISNQKADSFGQETSTGNDFELNQWMEMNYDAAAPPLETKTLLDEYPTSLSGPFNSFIEVPGTVDWVSCSFAATQKLHLMVSTMPCRTLLNGTGYV